MSFYLLKRDTKNMLKSEKLNCHISNFLELNSKSINSQSIGRDFSAQNWQKQSLS